MTTLKEALALALEKKNKQNHRINPKTKRGRQHIAETKDQQDCHARDIVSGINLKGTFSKRDI